MNMISQTLAHSVRDGGSRPVVTPTNRAPIVQVVTWMMLAAMFVSIAVRLTCRRYLIGQTGSDDAVVVLALLFALAQTLCVVVPTTPIWGRTLQEIQPSALAAGLKTGYAASLLFYASLAVAKVSVLLGLMGISKFHGFAINTALVAVVIWFLTSEFLIAFQCALPHPWDIAYGKCINELAIHVFAIVGNILTDLGIVYIAYSIIYPLRITWERRLFNLSLLCCRVLVVAAAIAQLVFLPRSFHGDYTFNSYGYFIAQEIVQALSIITCSLPFLYPFMKSLQSGSVFTDDIPATIWGSRIILTGDSGNRSEPIPAPSQNKGDVTG